MEVGRFIDCRHEQLMANGLSVYILPRGRVRIS